MSKKSWELTMDTTIAANVQQAAFRGLTLGAEHILGEANKAVPIEEHTLEESGTVTTDPKTLKAAIVYDTPYATYQHEVMGLKHDAGRGAKFLENAMNAETNTVREIIALTIKGEF
jgi:hypothetical protein